MERWRADRARSRQRRRRSCRAAPNEARGHVNFDCVTGASAVTVPTDNRERETAPRLHDCDESHRRAANTERSGGERKSVTRRIAGERKKERATSVRILRPVSESEREAPSK